MRKFGFDYFTNEFYTIDDLPNEIFTDFEKKMILEWFARKIIEAVNLIDKDFFDIGKSYDPLIIDLDKKEAYSYFFDLGEGGRVHEFASLQELEKRMVKELAFAFIEAWENLPEDQKDKLRSLNFNYWSFNKED